MKIVRCFVVYFVLLFCLFADTAFAGKVKAKKGFVLLVDDFNAADAFSNPAGGLIGGDDEEPGTCAVTYDTTPENGFGKTGASLKISYDLIGRGAYTYCFIQLGDLLKRSVAGQPKYLSFWVKGSEGGERFKIELHQDTNGNGQYDYGKDIAASVDVERYLGGKGITAAWQKAVIPLKDFKNIKKFSRVMEIVFVFDKGARSGVVYLDDLLFGSLPKKSSDSVFPENTFRVNGKPMRDNFNFDTANAFEIKVDEDIEALWFEISENDGKDWKRVSSAYNSGKAAFKAKWEKNEGKLINDFCVRVCAVTQRGEIIISPKEFRKCSLRRSDPQGLLDHLGKEAFNYFYENQNLNTGLFRDTAGSGDSSIAVSGFGLIALCIGAERGWIDKDEAKRRALLVLKTFLGNDLNGRSGAGDPSKPRHPRGFYAENKDGFFYHFLKFDTAKRAGNSEISTIDTAMLLCGMITAGEYFGGEIKEAARKIYERVDWLAFKDKNALDGKLLFFMGWTPEKGFLKGRWDYFSDETILVTLLAAGSPRNDISPEVFYAWKRERGSYGGGQPFIYSWYGSLFTYQYAHLFFDLRDRVDREGINWFRNSIDATIANRRFCMDNSAQFKTYGPNCWGITSALGTKGYSMSFGALPNGDRFPLHDGTISPLGAGASINFTPFQAASALQYMFETYPELIGQYGFKNSFNLQNGFYAADDYGLDLGAFLAAVENFRSGFVWKYFMRNEFVRNALSRTGFVKKEGYDRYSDYLEEVKADIQGFIGKKDPEMEEVYRVIGMMERLIEIGDASSYFEFSTLAGPVYEKILERLDADSNKTERVEKEFLKFLALNRLCRFKESEGHFAKFEKRLGSNGTELEKLKLYSKKLLEMKMLEGYLRRLAEKYFHAEEKNAGKGFSDGLKELAECALYNRAYPEAFDFYKELLEHKRRRESYDGVISVCGEIAGRFAEVEKIEYAAYFDLQEGKYMAAKGDNETKGFLIEQAQSYFSRGCYDSAKQFADLFLSRFQSGDEAFEVLVIRGICSKNLGNGDSAAADFKTVLQNCQKRETRDKALLQLGECYMSSEESKLALECFEELIEKSNDSGLAAAAVFNRGLVYFYDGETAKAREIFTAVVNRKISLSKEARRYLESIDKNQLNNRTSE